MKYFVAPKKSITSPRGIIVGGTAESRIVWQTLCRDVTNPKYVEAAQASLAKMIESGLVIESEEAPLTQEEAALAEKTGQMTQSVPLTSDGKPVTNLNLAQRKQLAAKKATVQNVPMTEPDKTEAELADAAAAEATKLSDAANQRAAEANQRAAEAKAASDAVAAEKAKQVSAAEATLAKEIASSDVPVPTVPPTSAPVGAQKVAAEDPLNPQP